MAEHAKKFSASSADRWVRCAGSINAVEGIEQTTSVYAEEGTKVHEIAANSLIKWHNSLKEFTYDELWGTYSDLLSDIVATYDTTLSHDLDNLETYLYYIASEFEEIIDGDTQGNNLKPHGFLAIEQKVNYSNLAPQGYDTTNDFFGTADAIIYDELTRRLHVIDLKWGKGVKVEVEENYQLICYAIGAMNAYGWLYDIEWIDLHIVQPRMNNTKSIYFGVEKLLEYEKLFKQAIQAALQPDAKRTPHDKACKWCPVKATCPALLELTKNAAISNFEKLELSDDDYRYILDNSDLISNFIKSVEEKTYNKLVAGGSLEGYKLVQGRSTRKWTDDAEEALKGSLGEAAYSKKLIGVTEADKKIPKEVMEELTQKEIGKPLLVKQEDKRQELIINETLTILEA